MIGTSVIKELISFNIRSEVWQWSLRLMTCSKPTVTVPQRRSKFTGKHLHQRLVLVKITGIQLKKWFQQRCYPGNFGRQCRAFTVNFEETQYNIQHINLLFPFINLTNHRLKFLSFLWILWNLNLWGHLECYIYIRFYFDFFVYF